MKFTCYKVRLVLVRQRESRNKFILLHNSSTDKDYLEIKRNIVTRVQPADERGVAPVEKLF